LALWRPRLASITESGRWSASGGLIFAAASDQQQLVAVARPNAEPDRGLDPGEVADVLEAPRLDHLERLRQELVNSPEEQDRVFGGGDRERLDLLQGHTGVVVFGGVAAVGVSELPGRVGVDQLERPLGWRCGCRELRVS
jgi:hypothetical protein